MENSVLTQQIVSHVNLVVPPLPLGRPLKFKTMGWSLKRGTTVVYMYAWVNDDGML